MAAINEIYEMRAYTLMGGQAGINVLHFRVAAFAGSGASDVQIADAWNQAIAATLKACMSSTASFRGVGVRRLKPTLSVETFSILNQGSGGVAGDPLPKQITGISTLRTLTPGRRGRGRIYVPFPAESQNDADQTPTAAYLVVLFNYTSVAIASLLAGINPNTNTLESIVYNRASGTGIPITSFTARDKWATQRRRGDYGRTNILPI